MSNSKNSINSKELRSRAEQMAQWLIAHPLEGDLDPHRLMHELQVHQVELEMQNAELRHAWAEIDKALRNANVEIEHLRKSGILDQVLDETRAPLRVIEDMSEQLRQLGVNVEQTKLLDKLAKANKKLQQIILASVELSAKPSRAQSKTAKKQNNN